MGRAPNLGVDWFLPRTAPGVTPPVYRGRRFATTTPASSDLIALLAAEGRTWRQVAEAIIFDPEAKAVADRFVDEGFGDELASVMVSPRAGVHRQVSP